MTYIVYKSKVKVFGGVHYSFEENQYYHENEILGEFKRKRKAKRFLRKIQNKPHLFLETFGLIKESERRLVI